MFSVKLLCTCAGRAKSRDEMRVQLTLSPRRQEQGVHLNMDCESSAPGTGQCEELYPEKQHVDGNLQGTSSSAVM